MKRTLALFPLLFCCCLCMAQVTLQPLLPQVGVFQKGQLWNVMAVNSSANSMECYLVLSLQDRVSGVEALSATSASFMLGKGAKQLNVADITPIQYSYVSSAGGGQASDFLTVGSYMACFKLMAGTEVPIELAEACVPFDVGPLSPPMLMVPADSSVLKSQPAMFTWQPPAPLAMFQQLHYELVIAEILPGQKPEEAVEQNAPLYTDLNVQGNVMDYTGAYPSFEKGKWYAWQVVARDGGDYAAKTDTWDFSIDTVPDIALIAGESPYIKMSKDELQKGVVPDDILKLSYDNETTDSVATIRITSLSNKTDNPYQFVEVVKRGENLIQYDLKKAMLLREGGLYQVEIINSRNEKWRMQFQAGYSKKAH